MKEALNVLLAAGHIKEIRINQGVADFQPMVDQLAAELPGAENILSLYSDKWGARWK